MRLLLLTLAFAAAPLAARAQDAPPGPFTFGMTRAEVQAIAPSAVWDEERFGPNTTGISSAMPVGVAGDIFRPRLFMHEGQVEGIAYGRFSDVTDAAGCAAQGAMAVRNMERDGLFNAERTPLEPTDTLFTVTNTPNGSVLRTYPVNEEGLVVTHAAREGPVNASVMAAYATRTPPGALIGSNYAPCLILVSFHPGRPTPLPIDSPTPEELAAAPLISGVQFTHMADGSDYARWYPPEAMDNDQEGRVVMQCLVAPDLSLRCAVESEEPAGAGFGDAALQISTRFRVAPQHEGEPTIGKRLRRTIVFRLHRDGE